MSLRQVKNTLTPPFRWICSIRTSYDREIMKTPTDTKPADTIFSTGVLVTPRHVLTNAHNIRGLYKRRGKFLAVEPTQVRVMPGRDDDRVLNGRPLGNYKAKTWKIPAAYQSYVNGYASAPFDYAIIELSRHAGHRKFTKLSTRGRRAPLGWWHDAYKSFIRPVDRSFASTLRSKKVNVCGYPGNADIEFTETSTPAGLQLLDFDNVTGVFIRLDGRTQSLMKYGADTSPGQSGSPVWIVDRKSKHRYLVAIHQGSHPNSGEALGVLITPTVMRQLEAWGVDALAVSNRTDIT